MACNFFKASGPNIQSEFASLYVRSDSWLDFHGSHRHPAFLNSNSSHVSNFRREMTGGFAREQWWSTVFDRVSRNQIPESLDNSSNYSTSYFSNSADSEPYSENLVMIARLLDGHAIE